MRLRKLKLWEDATLIVVIKFRAWRAWHTNLDEEGKLFYEPTSPDIVEARNDIVDACGIYRWKTLVNRMEIIFFLADSLFLFAEIDFACLRDVILCFHDIRLGWTSARKHFIFLRYCIVVNQPYIALTFRDLHRFKSFSEWEWLTLEMGLLTVWMGMPL